MAGESSVLTQELEEARKVQMGMLPRMAPEVPGFKIAAHIAPALSVGGDFYDFIPLQGEKLGIVFGDAVGHGIASALLMSMTLANFRFVSPMEARPQTVINHINHHLCLAKGVSQSSSVTAVYAILDWQENKISCSVAGLQPYLIRDGDCESVVVGGTRFPLGITEDTAYESGNLEPAVGESLVLTTDGIPESMDANGDLYGFERLEKVLSENASLGARKIIEAVLRDVQIFVGDVSQQDDINIVVIKRTDPTRSTERAGTQRPILANELMIKSVFQYVLSPRVIDRLVQNPSKFQLEGAERELTVFFSDMRNATGLLGALPPRELYEYFNEYFDLMTQVILDNDGMLDKFVGDEIMALWGAPVYFEDHAFKACKAALEMQEVLEMLRVKWRREGKPEVRVGMGINSGPMVIGSIGTRNRMMYTPFGDHVNLGARLEVTNKKYGTNILISEFTYEMAKDRIVARKIDTIEPKIRSHIEQSEVAIYELIAVRDTDGN